MTNAERTPISPEEQRPWIVCENGAGASRPQFDEGPMRELIDMLRDTSTLMQSLGHTDLAGRLQQWAERFEQALADGLDLDDLPLADLWLG